jgi:protein O-mannosyl-transferase
MRRAARQERRGSARDARRTLPARRVWPIAAALATVVTAVYLRALGGAFLNWDDNVYVTENPYIQDGLSWRTLAAVFTTVHTGNWIPLTWLSHALDLQLYGHDPLGHHVTALVLHVANTILLFLVLRRVTGAVWRSAVVAALFGLHPLHVESVAWVSERKDVLSTFFWLLAIAAYARYLARQTAGRYLLVAAALVVGLLAKPMLVTLPFVLLLLDYWPLGRLSWRAVREKVPLVALALAFAAGAFTAQRAAGAMEQAARVGLADRLANAVVCSVEYLRLTVWPVDLSPWYSHPALEGPRLPVPVVGRAALVLLAISLLAAVTVKRRPYLAVGWLWYLGTLFPVIGVVQIGAQAMADRYTYVPLIGIFVAVTWLLGALPWWRHPVGRRAGTAITAGVLAVLSALTWRQIGVWHDSATFWAYTLRVNPRAAVGYYAVGTMLAKEGRSGEAVHAYRRALKLRPDLWSWHAEVADLLYGQGRLAAAEAHYRKAVALRPDEPVVRNSLANVLMRQDRLQPARRQLEAALARRPDFAEAHNNLGIVLAREGRLREAVGEFEAALRVRPDLAAARTNLAAVQAALAGDDDPS